MKQYFIITLLTFITSNAIAAVCPSVKVEATCEENVWKLSYSYPDIPWDVTGESVTGKNCSKPRDVTQAIKWIYALEYHLQYSALMYCNYSVLDHQLNVIGSFQLESSSYRRDKGNWRSVSHDIWKCNESQESCKISRVI